MPDDFDLPDKDDELDELDEDDELDELDEPDEPDEPDFEDVLSLRILFSSLRRLFSSSSCSTCVLSLSVSVAAFFLSDAFSLGNIITLKDIPKAVKNTPAVIRNIPNPARNFLPPDAFPFWGTAPYNALPFKITFT